MESYNKKDKTLRAMLDRVIASNRDIDGEALFSWFDEQQLEVAILKIVKKALSRKAGLQWKPGPARYEVTPDRDHENTGDDESEKREEDK